MTRITGKLFDDGRDGILAIKPSEPFFGVSRDERFYQVTRGEIDFELLPTPPGVVYFVGYKDSGDTRQTSYTLKWRVPKTQSLDITPGKEPEQPEAAVVRSSSVYERVQLKRVADDLSDTLVTNKELTAKLAQAEHQVDQLKAEMRAYQKTADQVLFNRDQTIAQLNESRMPEVRTVYVDKPVPPEPLEKRIKTLEQENVRLLNLNSEYYKSVVELHQLKLDRAHNTNEAPTLDADSSPQQRLLRKFLGK